MRRNQRHLQSYVTFIAFNLHVRTDSEVSDPCQICIWVQDGWYYVDPMLGTVCTDDILPALRTVYIQTGGDSQEWFCIWRQINELQKTKSKWYSSSYKNTFIYCLPIESHSTIIGKIDRNTETARIKCLSVRLEMERKCYKSLHGIKWD